MDILGISEIIEHCNKQLARLPSGTRGYAEHESVRYHLQRLNHFLSLNVPASRLLEMIVAIRTGKMFTFPCKPGDSIYILFNGEISEDVVNEITISSDDIMFVCEESSYELMCFGSWVFASLEEAEAAREMDKRG